MGYDETLKTFRIYLPALRKVVVRREVRFEEWAFRKSRESVQGEQQVPIPQVALQVPLVQVTGSQVSGVIGTHSTGTRSSVSVVQPTGSSRTGFGSQVTGLPYIGTGSQISPVVGSPTLGTQISGPSTSGNSSVDDRPVWDQPSRKKKPKWL